MRKTVFNLKTILCFVSLLFCAAGYSQNVAINDTGASPDPSAILDVQSAGKGILVPRLTEAQRDSVVSPALGLLIFQTDHTPGFYYYDGSAWAMIAGSGGGDFWNNAGFNNISNTNTGNVGIGTDEPYAKLEIKTGEFDPTQLALDGSESGSANMILRVHQPSPTEVHEFHVHANEYGENPKLDFIYSDQEYDLIRRRHLITLTPQGDTVLNIHGDALADGSLFAKGAHIFRDEEGDPIVVDLVSIISEDPTINGLHVCLNNSAIGGNAVVGHAEVGTGVEGWSNEGVGARFSSNKGPALVTPFGHVGFGTETPNAQVNIKDDGSGKPELLLETTNNASVAFRRNYGATGNYNQLNADSDGSKLSLTGQNTVFNPDGTAMSSISQIVEFGGTAAVTAFGNVNVHSEVNRPSTGAANLLPIAYGTVLANGNPYTSTGNFTCIWNSSFGRYEIAINGENYYYLSYISTVTPMTGGNQVRTSSVGGKLLVEIYNSAGAKVQGAFQFVTFKP